MRNELTRDFTVAVFVVHREHVLLHPHAKLGIWLPPGGHIDAPELPDEAAHREMAEEAGIEIELLGDRGLQETGPDIPQQLVRPEGIQLEVISPDHHHIDLIYFARVVNPPAEGMPDVLSPMQWVTEAEFGSIGVNDEVAAWSRRALAAME